LVALVAMAELFGFASFKPWQSASSTGAVQVHRTAQRRDLHFALASTRRSSNFLLTPLFSSNNLM
jgi:hypothetical protein